MFLMDFSSPSKRITRRNVFRSDLVHHILCFLNSNACNLISLEIITHNSAIRIPHHKWQLSQVSSHNIDATKVSNFLSSSAVTRRHTYEYVLHISIIVIRLRLREFSDLVCETKSATSLDFANKSRRASSSSSLVLTPQFSLIICLPSRHLR